MIASSNGRTRKSLAEQIDRLDKVLDGLADGLNEAVASAVQVGVRAALVEILGSPEFAAILQTPRDAEVPEAEVVPTVASRMASAGRGAWAWLGTKVQVVRRAVVAGMSRFRRVLGGARETATACAATVRDRLVETILRVVPGVALCRRIVSSRATVFAIGLTVGLMIALVSPRATGLVGSVTASEGWWWLRHFVPAILFGIW